MMIPVLIGVSFIVFFLMYISPGDPAKMILGEMAQASDLEAMRQKLGLNDPFFIRYLHYLRDLVFHLDLGTSYSTMRPVSVEVLERFPVTLKLASTGVLVALLIGIPYGIFAGAVLGCLSGLAVKILYLRQTIEAEAQSIDAAS